MMRVTSVIAKCLLSFAGDLARFVGDGPDSFKNGFGHSSARSNNRISGNASNSGYRGGKNNLTN